jgi:general stress protein 26
MQAPENKGIDKLVEMVKDIRSCMLITNPTKAGGLSGRPMGVNTVDEDGTMWFFTKRSSNKADEIKADSEVSVAIVDDSESKYLMINGYANIVDDKAKMEELWNPILKAWFPDGLEDPDITLIKVIPQEADYWDSSSSTMVNMFRMVKALVTGQESEGGEYGKINI